MNILYYTVCNKDYGRQITVWKLEDCNLKLFAELESLNDDFGVPFYTNEEEIQEYLDMIEDDTDYTFKPLK